MTENWRAGEDLGVRQTHLSCFTDAETQPPGRAPTGERLELNTGLPVLTAQDSPPRATVVLPRQ